MIELVDTVLRIISTLISALLIYAIVFRKGQFHWQEMERLHKQNETILAILKTQQRMLDRLDELHSKREH